MKILRQADAWGVARANAEAGRNKTQNSEAEKQQRRDLNRRLAEKLVNGWSAFEYRQKFDNELALALDGRHDGRFDVNAEKYTRAVVVTPRSFGADANEALAATEQRTKQRMTKFFQCEMEWRIEMNRPEYLRQHLSKTLSPEQIDPARITYDRLMSASSQLLEYWQLVRKADVDNALRQPAGQAAAKKSKDENAFRRFATGEGWTADDHKQLVESMKRIKVDFPAVVHNQDNSNTIANWLIDSKRYPSYSNMKLAVTTLVCEGKLLLSPGALGPEFEQRYGDELFGPHAMSRVSAADLRAMTTPFRSQNEQDTIRNMSADEFYKSEHGCALREERNRHANQVIREQQIRQAEAAVELFLSANRDYARTNDNRDQMLRWLEDHNLPITQNTLQQAFDELKHQLALTPDNNAEYGATRVVDYADLGPTNPIHSRPPKQHVELVEQKSVKKITIADVRKMSAEQFASALRDTDLGPQVEALLADQ